MIIDAKISIDTEIHIGATCVYGVYEIKRILEEGAKVCKYNMTFDEKREYVSSDKYNDKIIVILK